MDELLSDMFEAYYEARKNKRNTVNQLHFEIDLEENIVALYHEIRQRRYQPLRSICFTIDYPVKREIFAADFRDRVVHHLLFKYINPYMERQLIYDCYSCRAGKGTLFGIKRLEHHIRSCSQNYTRPCYVLKLDLKGYFMSINREILYQNILSLLSRYMDKKTASGEYFRNTWQYELVHYLLPVIILNDPTQNCYRKGKLSDWDDLPPSKSLFHTPEGQGLPIGNLTSQLFSNVYLNDFDNYVKRVLRVKHYGRYVDDFFLLHEDKNELLRLKNILGQWLMENLGLEIHPKKVYLQPVEHGVPFLGAVIKPFRRYTGNRTVKKFRQTLAKTEKRLEQKPCTHEELKHITASVNSYMGYLKQYKSYNIKKKLIFDKQLRLYEYGYFTNNKFVLKKR